MFWNRIYIHIYIYIYILISSSRIDDYAFQGKTILAAVSYELFGIKTKTMLLC